jgi:hypothetical protein
MAVILRPAGVVVVVEVPRAVVLIRGRPRSRPTPARSTVVQTVPGDAARAVWTRPPWFPPTTVRMVATARTPSRPMSARQGWYRSRG